MSEATFDIKPNDSRPGKVAHRALSAAADAPAAPAPGYWKSVAQRLSRDPVTIAVTIVLLGILFITIGAPLVTGGTDPYAGSVLARLKPIGTTGHWLGTDETGRDLWTRLCYGGRLSLLAAILPVTISLVAGGFLGILAGYAGGIVGTLIMRTMDVFYAFPSILLAIAICGLLGNGLSNSIIALAVVFIPPMVRVAETVTTQARHLDFVEAARASGTTTLQIIRHHVLANVLGPILVYATSLISVSIILSAGLSFLGLGVTPPQAEWGLMLNSLRQAIYVQPYVAALPGLMIFITSMCFNLMSDGFRSAMDVRLNK
jgi:peptide/nickel transport system permease protein